MSISRASSQRTARSLLTARIDGSQIDPRGTVAGVRSEDDAYVVQSHVAKEAPATALGSAAGYKIGMSCAPAQQQFGLAEPLYGRVFRTRLLKSGDRLEAGTKQRLGAECEIVAKLGTDLEADDAGFDAQRILQAVRSFHVGMELLENRFDGAEIVSVWMLAADDLMGYGGVIGQPLKRFDPTAAYKGELIVDGQTRASGITSDLQGGGPVGCLGWLADKLARSRVSLSAGDVVFCGGITNPVWIEPPQSGPSRVVSSIEGLGDVDLFIDWVDR